MGASVAAMFADVGTDLTSVLTAVVPVIIPVGVLIIGVFLAWKLVKKFAGAR